MAVAHKIVPEPRTSFLSPTTERLLAALPPFLQSAVDVQGTLDALAVELDRLDALVTEVQENLVPTNAGRWLDIWEAALGLPVAPADKSELQRRETVLAFVRKWKSAGTGRVWEETLTTLLGSGWSYREHIPGDATGPAAHVIRITLPYTEEIAAPTGLAATPGAGGSGTLAAGTYYYVVTATNFYGETTASAEVSATAAANGSIALDWNDAPGATGYVVYRGSASGQTRKLEAVTASAYTDDGTPAPGTQPPPNTNTTASFRATEVERLVRDITPAHIAIEIEYGEGFIVGVSRVGDVL